MKKAALMVGVIVLALAAYLSLTETPDRLYIQSLHAKGLGWLPK